eukprot:TRINITY_DN72269_c0_g1_i1.p2 TRINITY_DN72269_c0_g1~~TRINITY_DN72269_c0_g1_i1.p2  ORF type:complete len:187 (+),score=24.30 TRINITY_DN72269_c0_g1_i1:62-562(+)
MDPAATTSAEEAIDTKKLSGVDIEQLAKNDPNFISLLIRQLDGQMNALYEESRNRKKQIAEDTKELQQLDQDVQIRIQPKLDNLKDNLQKKQQLKTHLETKLSEEQGNFVKLELALLIQQDRLHMPAEIYRNQVYQVCCKRHVDTPPGQKHQTFQNKHGRQKNEYS